MFYLVLAIMSSALVSIIMRLSEKYIHNNISMLMVNYIVCSISAYFFTTFTLGKGLPITLLLGVFGGIIYLISFLLLQYNVYKNGVVLSSLYAKLGIIVPVLMSILLFSEVPTIFQVVGLILSAISIFYMNMQKGEKIKLNITLLSLLIVNGMTDGLSKVFEQVGNQEQSSLFLFVIFVFAFIGSFILMLTKKQKVGKEELLFGVLIGVPNFFSAKFLLRALYSLQAVVVYPTYSILAVVVVSIVGVLLFKEKLTKKLLISIMMISIAIGLLNV